MPYKRSQTLHGVTDKKTICKITPFNKFGMKILPSLTDDEKSKYFVESVDSVTTDTTFENKIQKMGIYKVSKITKIGKPKFTIRK